MGCPPTAGAGPPSRYVPASGAAIGKSIPVEVLAAKVHGPSLAGPRTYGNLHVKWCMRDTSIVELNLLAVLAGVQLPDLRRSSYRLDPISVPLLPLSQAPNAPGFDDAFVGGDQGTVGARGAYY